jgi:hypothetical protein
MPFWHCFHALSGVGGYGKEAAQAGGFQVSMFMVIVMPFLHVVAGF